jgi:hypothetical protein
MRSFLTAATTFECELSEADFQKLFNAIVRLESGPPMPMPTKLHMPPSPMAEGGPSASSSPVDLVRPQLPGPRARA